jgi:hypothetical protein
VWLLQRPSQNEEAMPAGSMDSQQAGKGNDTTDKRDAARKEYLRVALNILFAYKKTGQKQVPTRGIKAYFGCC